MKNSLIDLSTNLYNELSKNIEYLSKLTFSNFSKRVEVDAKERYQGFIEEKINILDLFGMLNIGSTINYDLLAEFLLNTIYIKPPKGPYNKSEVDVMVIDCYDKFKKDDLLNTISQFVFIHEMLKIFILFVRRNYFPSFFDKNIIINKDLSKYAGESVLEFNRVVNAILKHGKIIFNKDFKNANKVLEFIKEEEIKKEDLVSSMVDTMEYNDLIIYQYKLMIREIELYLEFIKYNKPEREVSSEECEIFKNFAISFKEFIYSRIDFLENPLVKVK